MEEQRLSQLRASGPHADQSPSPGSGERLRRQQRAERRAAATAAPVRSRRERRGEAAERRPGGRPTKLDPELERRVCALVRGGASLEDAAACVGVSRSTLHRWLSGGRRPGAPPPLASLVVAVERARAEGRLVPLAHVQRAAARGRWRAAAWFLEYRFPADWALNWRGDAARARLASPTGPAVASTDEVEGRARSGKGGIPAKLTPEVEARLCQTLRAGAFPADAAAYAGISRSTLYRWLKAGREPGAEPRLAAFATAVRQAEAHAVVAALKVIFRCGMEGDWRAACWWLERMYPDHFGPVDQLGRRRFGRRPAGGRLERLC